MKIRKARTRDLPEIFHLLQKNELPLDGVSEHLKDFLVTEEGKKIVGCAGIEVYGSVGLLRSVCVSKDWRGKGLGKTLTQEALKSAKKRNIKELFLLTTTAVEFFKRFGFSPIERKEVDPLIQQTAEFSSLCSCSATVMTKILNAHG